MIRNKRILITGGAGFIGTALAERLVKENEIVLLDSNFEHNSFALSNLKNNSNVKIARVDILDIEELSKAIQDVQIVVHTAAVLGVQRVIHNALHTLDVNYIGTSNLLKAASRNSCCERVVSFSTSEVFGSNAFRVAEDGNSVLNSVQDVRWCYSISKLAAEHLVFAYFREKGLPVVVVRPFNVFGPGRIGEHVVLQFILSALRNEDLIVYGDGAQIRAWCYIDDFCYAVLRCMEVEGAVGEAFNIGNPRNTLTIYELARKIVSFCGSKSKIIFRGADFADIDIRVPNISKAGNILGYAPKVELEEGLSKTIEWVRKNVDELSLRVRTEPRTYIPRQE